MILVSLLFVANLAHAGTEPVIDYTVSPYNTVKKAEIADCEKDSFRGSALVEFETKKSLMDLCLKEKVSKQKVVSAYKDIENLKSSTDNCAPGTIATLFSSHETNQKKLAVCAKKYSEAEEKNVGLKSELNKQLADLNKAEKDFKDKLTTVSESVNAKTNINELVKDQFTNMKLSIYGDLLQAGDAADTLNKMSRALDNSALGLYMRDRMAGLLNSEAMCTASKACTSASPRNIKGSDLNPVFNSEMKTSARDAQTITLEQKPDPAPAPAVEK